MRTYWNFFAAALMAVLLTTGCRSGGALPPVNTTKYDLENRANAVVLDKGVQRSVTYSGLQERVRDDGRLEVAANIRNRENRRIEVQVNCEFKDDQGFVVDSTPWEPLMLTENEQQSVRFVSMNSQARRYTIRVRQPR
jgi:uncharacterized protein YcfL